MSSFDLSSLNNSLSTSNDEKLITSLLQSQIEASLHSDAFPISKTYSVIINDLPTEILITKFSNTYFIIITQINKIGTIVHAWSEIRKNQLQLHDDNDNNNQSNSNLRFLTKVLIGKRDDPLLEIYARQILENINKVYEMNEIYLGISLQEEGRSRESFVQIINIILENITLL